METIGDHCAPLAQRDAPARHTFPGEPAAKPVSEPQAGSARAKPSFEAG